MKNRISALACLLFLSFSLVLFAQQDEKACTLKIKAFGIDASEHAVSEKPIDIATFKSVYTDLLHFKPIDTLEYKSVFAPVLLKAGIYMSLEPSVQNRSFYQELRLGLGYSFYRGYYLSGYITKAFGPDTLINEPKTLVTKDSVYSIGTSYQTKSHAITINALYLIKTNPLRKLSIWSGLGLEMGNSVASCINESYHNGYDIRYITEVSTPMYPEIDPITSTQRDFRWDIDGYQTKIQNSFSLRAFIPVGLSCRFSKKENFFGKMTYNLAYCFGYDLRLTPGFKPSSGLFYGLSTGFKYSI